MSYVNSDPVKLPGDFDVSPAFMAAVRNQTEIRIPMLVHDTLYRAKDILGKAYWQRLSKWEDFWPATASLIWRCAKNCPFARLVSVPITPSSMS